MGCIPVTTVTRTLLDLGALASVKQVERALDSAFRQRLTTIDRLDRCLQENAGRGRRGAGILRHLLAQRDPAAALLESPLEKRLLQILRQHGLPIPASQYRIYRDDRLVARVDFAYPELKLAIEADGYLFHSEKSDWERDRERDAELAEIGMECPESDS